MTVKELIEELKKYPENYSVEIRGRYGIDNVRYTGKCSVSFESDNLNDQFKYYEQERDKLVELLPEK